MEPPVQVVVCVQPRSGKLGAIFIPVFAGKVVRALSASDMLHTVRWSMGAPCLDEVDGVWICSVLRSN